MIRLTEVISAILKNCYQTSKLKKKRGCWKSLL